MNKKLKIQNNYGSDEYQTPREAINILIPHIKKEWKVWECAWGKGNLFNFLKESGFNVVGTGEEFDFLKNCIEYDCIVTNPPYSLKNKFLERCYSLQKPFALLMPLTALEGKQRGKLYKEFGIQLIIPNKRINFETLNGKGSGAWFQTAWFTYGFDLPKDLFFVELI